MTKTQMPEPLRLRWNKYTGRYDISEDHRAAGDADLITTTQAEAYANGRVREALEEAEQICRSKEKDFLSRSLRMQHHIGAGLGASMCGDAIRALIPPTKNEAE